MAKNLRRHSHFIVKQHEGTQQYLCSLILTLLPCKQAELSCIRGILVSDICCRSRSQPRTVSGSKTGFDSFSPLVLWRCEASPQPAPAIASHWRNSQTNDCSASYPELSGSTIGRVTRPRMLPLRILPISNDRYGDIIRPCTALHRLS